MVATLLTGLGLVLLIEGLVYALAPSFVEDLLEALRQVSLDQRRAFGILTVCLGAVILWSAALLS